MTSTTILRNPRKTLSPGVLSPIFPATPSSSLTNLLCGAHVDSITNPHIPNFFCNKRAASQHCGLLQVQVRSFRRDGFSNEGRFCSRQTFPGRQFDSRPSVPFDICGAKHGERPMEFKPPLHLASMDEESTRSSEQRVLRPGMVLLKNYISKMDQIKITQICRDLGVGHGGFYQPCFSSGAKLRLQMMCLGMDWDPETRLYKKCRSKDGAIAPFIPKEFTLLVEMAIRDSHALIKRELKVNGAEHVLPWMKPDICIVNFYSEAGKLGLHQDRDESRKSLSQGLPVVSFSIGDSAEFLYGNVKDVDEAERVVLESGDVLLFGGEARHVFHGVPFVYRGTTPKFLNEETNLRPGRLNLTFRKY